MKEPATGLNFKKANIRIWIHQRNLLNLQQVVWEGHGSKLLVEHSNNSKIKKFLEAVPHIMGLIKNIHTDVINDDLESLKQRVSTPILPIVFSGKDVNGLAPLHKAAGLGKQSIADYIISVYPESLNLTDSEGRTPLHYSALAKDDGEMMNFLLEKGADESVLDNRHKTAAYYKNRPSELDAKLLTVIPESPRNAKESFLTKFDWSILTAVTPIEDIQKTLRKHEHNNVPNGETPTEEKKVENVEEEEKNGNEEPPEEEKNGSEEPPEEEKNSNEEPPEEEKPEENGVSQNEKEQVETPPEEPEEEEKPVEEEKEPAQENDNNNNEAEEENTQKDEEVEIVEPEQEETENPPPEEPAAQDDEEDTNNNSKSPVVPPEIEIVDENPEVEPEGVIEGIVNGENEVETLNNEGRDATDADDNGEDPEIAALVESGNMEHLAAMVLNGEGDKLIGHSSDNAELQSFLDNVQVYMTKIHRIHLAAKSGSLRDLQAALDRRKFAVAKDKVSPNGTSPLHTAVVYGNTSIVRYLAGRFPETLQVTDNDGRTPLHYAAVLADNGHYFNLLIHLGADSRAEDQFGHIPEYYRNHQDEFSHAILLQMYGEEGTTAESILQDQVPSDIWSARKPLDDEDMINVLERCYGVLHGRRNSHSVSSAASTTSSAVSSTGSSALISKHTKRYIFDSVKLRLTSLDHNLYDVIWPSVKKLPTEASLRIALEQDFPAGIVAPDEFIYKIFGEFVEPIIKDYNAIDGHFELGKHPESKFAKDNGMEVDVAFDLDHLNRWILAGFIVPQKINNNQVDMPFFATEEGRYLASSLGDPLIKGLTEVANKRPDDPIAYLATYLYNFANNRPNLHSRGKIQENQQIVTGGPQLINDNKAVPATIDVVTVEPEDNGEDDSAFNNAARDEHGQSMLHFAAARAHGRNALFQLLIETDINVAFRDELYRTARDISIQANLSDNTAEIDRYVISIATKGDTDKLVELLLDGYDHITDLADENEVPIVEAVAQHNQPDTVSFLQSILTFEEKRERVHHAIRLGNINDVKMLLADENDTGSGKLLAMGKNNYGRCSLHIAVLCQQEEIVDYLAITFPDTLALGDNLERSALHYAMGVEHMETISRVLIKAGAKRIVKDLKGRQPTYYFLNKSDILRLQEEEETF